MQQEGLKLDVRKNFPVLSILFLMKLCYYVEFRKT